MVEISIKEHDIAPYKMSDNIELNSYSIRGVESDAEEYHEIIESAIYSENPIQNALQSPRTQTFFFTETKEVKKKKKKRETKDKLQDLSNVMKVITKKMDRESSPIIKNVINVLEESNVPSYLQIICRPEEILHYSPRNFDIEHGNRTKSLKLNATFSCAEKDSRNSNIHVNYVEPNFFTSKLSGKAETDLKVTDFFLDISINGLHFTCHYSFSVEKVLSLKLEEYYIQYIEIDEHIQNILRAIEINRQTRENLKVKFTALSSKKKDIRFDETILKYTSAFLDLKKRYYHKLNEKRMLLNNILSLWFDINCIRHKLGVTRSPYILEVEKLYVNEEILAETWSVLFQKEYSDLLIELEYDYVTKYLEYKKIKKAENSDKNKLAKPNLHIDPKRIKRDVEKRVSFLLNPEDVSVTWKFDETLQKKIERKVSSEENCIYLKVYVDDVFVCESERLEIEDYSAINYKDSLTLQILESNRTLTFILCEGGKDMSALTLDLDQIRKKSMPTTFIDKHFVYYEKIMPTPSHVGNGYTIKDIAAINGVELKSNHLFKEKLFTVCEMKMNASWNKTFNSNANENISLKHCLNVKKKIHRILHGVDKPNLSTLLDVLSDVYATEINDENIIKNLKDMCKNTTKEDVTFDFCDGVDCTRFKLLRLRNVGSLVNISNKTIPLFDSQISTEQLSSIQQNEEKEFNVEYFESQCADMDPIDLQRYIGIQFIEKLNKKILTELNDRLMRKTHKDVVKDYQDLSIRSLFSMKTNMSLATSSSVNKKQSIEAGLAKEQEIYITILRAFNLYDRCGTEEQESDGNIQVAGFKVRPLRPFVRLNYNNESVQTCTAVGNNPTWNYTTKIKTKLEPLSSLYINIYDEDKENIGKDLDQSFRYRCHNKWLGTLAIPISTVLNFGSIRGTFKITTPATIFGYENAPKETTSIIPEIIRLMKKDTAFLTLRVTTSLSNLGGLQFYNQPYDTDDHILRHLNNFVTEYLNEFPSRNLSLTFVDSTGKHKCVSEFIQPLPLPEISLSDAKSMGSASKSSSPKTNIHDFELTDISKMVDLAIRYVSLIPTYEVMQSQVVTLCGTELLKILYGSPLDHTLLLASHLLALGIKCHVVIGYGLPRGLSSYVLVKYNGRRILKTSDNETTGFLNKKDYDVFVFDAVNGEKHDIRDVGCPLKTVNFVFDYENIWVNMQSYQDCENLSFDFTKSSNWRMVFNGNIFVIKQTAITNDVYSPPFEVAGLRNNLENKIKDKIQKWRWNIKTIWNRYLSNILRESLTQWEHWSFNTNVEKPAPGDSMKQLLESYKIFGFPINMPYVNTKSVISRVKSTMLHMNDDPNTEFGLAVEVYAYRNNVISVWIFLATMTRMI